MKWLKKLFCKIFGCKCGCKTIHTEKVTYTMPEPAKVEVSKVTMNGETVYEAPKAKKTKTKSKKKETVKEKKKAPKKKVVKKTTKKEKK